MEQPKIMAGITKNVANFYQITKHIFSILPLNLAFANVINLIKHPKTAYVKHFGKLFCLL